MKKSVKVLTVVAILLIFVSITTFVLAAPPNPSEYTGDDNYSGTSSIGKIGNQLIQIISTVGSIASVIVLVVIGIKYMMGSAEEKAEYKKTLLPYIIGAAFVFAASTIATFVFNFTSNLGV